jgi:MinD-like ATPase involved in chromosome partitioning or flagellar assembly
VVDDNADRVHGPGQQPAPERDIEPLWPPDPTEPLPAGPGQPWASGGANPSAMYPSLNQPPAGCPPPADPSPGHPPTAPPPPGGEWAPPPVGEPSWQTPPAAGPVPNPRNGRQPPAPVDLDQPFTLDQPAIPGPDDPAGQPGGGRTSAESPWALPPQRPPVGESAPDTANPAGQDTSASPGDVPGPASAPPMPGPYPPPPLPPMPPLPPVSTGTAAPDTAGWYPPWQQAAPQPGVSPVPQQPYLESDGVTRMPAGYPDPAWSPEGGAAPTAEDFARRRQVRPVDPVATMGVRAVVNRMGLVRLPPGRHEQELKRDIDMVRRNFGGLRQVTVVNPKGGAGKTVAILLLAMTFGQKRGGYVLAWDNNETQGTLGMRAQQDFHSRTVRDMLRDLGQFQGAHGRVGDLSQYVRSQGEGMFDVLASDESATGGEMLTASAFAEIREVVSRFYKLIFVDTGNNVRAQNWQAAMDATDQLVVTMSARNDSAETAARMLDHLEQSGRQRLVRQAVTVVSMPPSRKEIDLPAIQEHFAARTRGVLLAPYERLIDTGEPIRYGQLSSATRDAWLKIAAAVAEGL